MLIIKQLTALESSLTTDAILTDRDIAATLKILLCLFSAWRK